MNAHATIVPAAPRARRAKLSLKSAETPAAAPETAVSTSVLLPSSPEPIALRLLRRAPENVRHTRIDEDVDGLADDIAAHGLLQGLIGYRFEGAYVEIVGGGRRLQALQKLKRDGGIDGDFPVHVLIRDLEDAIELSLAENLQQRTMSPVDEFFAFKTLMDRGDTSPALLAKRFGFSERVVKQRLRLAELAPEILDALADRKITIDSAMAYAGTQDRDLQSEVFKVESRKTWGEPHQPRDIKGALLNKGIRTDDPLFKFAGAEAYERRGGGYEDDLFQEEGAERVLANPGLLQETVAELIAFRMERLLAELRQRADLAPNIAGYVVAIGQRIRSYGNVGTKPAGGFVSVEKWDPKPMWSTIRNNGFDVHVLVGVDDAGELVAWPKTVFVPKAQKAAIDPPQQGYQQETPEQRAARDRELGVAKHARRLAVGPFAGTPFEGRAYWPQWSDDRAETVAGKKGWLVRVNIFVDDATVAAQQASAEKEYERELAERAAEAEAKEQAKAANEEREKALLAIPEPALVVVDGEAWERNEDGTYAAIDEDGDGGYAGSWAALVGNYRWSLDEIGETFETREAFDAAMAAAQADAPADEVSA